MKQTAAREVLFNLMKLRFLLLIQFITQVSSQDIHNACVLTATGHDDISVVHVVSDVLLIHRAYGGQVLLADILDLAAAVTNVALDAPQEADIGININVQLQEHKIGQPLIKERMDSFYNEYICRADDLMAFHAAVLREIIRFARDFLSRQQQPYIVIQQIMVKDA